MLELFHQIKEDTRPCNH